MPNYNGVINPNYKLYRVLELPLNVTADVESLRLSSLGDEIYYECDTIPFIASNGSALYRIPIEHFPVYVVKLVSNASDVKYIGFLTCALKSIDMSREKIYDLFYSSYHGRSFNAGFGPRFFDVRNMACVNRDVASWKLIESNCVSMDKCSVVDEDRLLCVQLNFPEDADLEEYWRVHEITVIDYPGYSKNDFMAYFNQLRRFYSFCRLYNISMKANFNMDSKIPCTSLYPQ